MLKYVSMMVTAYSNTTGKSAEDALRDLNIDDFVRIQDLEEVTDKELLSMMPKDKQGVMRWVDGSMDEGA